MRALFHYIKGGNSMRKKIFTLLLTLTMICGFSMSALAGTTSEVVKTSEGKEGWIYITFRCTCVQTSIPTKFSWTSSITPQDGIKVEALNYTQNGSITFWDYTYTPFSNKYATYSVTEAKTMLGGYSDMTASSTSFGSASKKLSVTR